MSRLYEGWLNDNATVTRYRRYSASSSRDGAPMLRSMREAYLRQVPFVRGDDSLQ